MAVAKKLAPKRLTRAITGKNKDVKKSLPRKTPRSTAPKRGKNGQRLMELPKYRAFRLSKPIKHHKPALPKARKLFFRSIKLLFRNWRLMGGIMLVYLVLSLVFVHGFSSQLGLGDIKMYLDTVFGTGFGYVITGFSVFNLLLNNLGSASSDVAGAYAATLLIVMSLVIIYALRQILSNTKTTVKQSFYRSMYPLIPFLLVLMVVGVQILPIAADTYIYNLAVKQGVAVSFIEKAFLFTFFGFMALWSLYMVSSSLFALYIVALPDVLPRDALRAAHKLVHLRRWMVMRKILYLLVMLLVTAVIILFPIIIWVPVAAEWVFFVLTLFAVMLIHTYLYSLYRELLA